MEKPVKRIVRVGAPVAVLTLVVMYLGISYLIASGVTKAERNEQEDSLGAYGVEFETIEFESRRGDVTLDGWYVPPVSQHSVIIYVHGIGSVRTGDGLTDLAARLHQRGFGALMFDLRAHGSSGGDKISGGYHERFDVLGGYDYLLARGVEPDDIGVLGMSMGAGTAALAAAEEPGIEALILDSPYAKASELIAQETARKTPFPEWFVPLFEPGVDVLADLLFDIDIEALAPEAAVANLGYPLMVIYGTDDTRIPTDHSQRVYDAAPAGSTVWVVEGVEHTDAFVEKPDEYSSRVAEYFLERLGAE
ncbi:MAG: alpha/beta fold hydrolase [SAR202 cluster bacterium]|jgi:pimeloyl-ACP methyl ester carboxylesterase|nr:alpha/beta fold hydrolase [SAR202 cluster bacterium]MQG70537.1 alpha/beta fold hydrolase [SAR202 cluster bacterium]HAL49137.1 hypothetical protein [Dehalococcoidia bacterium]|tara:strand:- start:436 stop:1353 length:918 start_codon:yes stop_codon:yes gene_type:complete